MSKNISPARERILEAAKMQGVKSAEGSFASRCVGLRKKVIADFNSLVPAAGGGQFGLESLDGVTPSRNASFDAVRDGDVNVLVKGLSDLKMSDRHIPDVAEQCLNLFDSKRASVSDILRTPSDVSAYSENLTALVGRTAYSSIASQGENFALEYFGEDTNRLNTDDRLSMDLIIMRPWHNPMDKGLARVSDASPVVTMRIPAPEAYNWAVGQTPGSTTAQRFSPSNRFKLRDLYRDPTPVNTTPQRIVPLAANDTGSYMWSGNTGTTSYLNVGKTIPLMDLSANQAVVSYATVDRSDLIADGGNLDSVLVSVHATVAGAGVTEVFLVNTNSYTQSYFVAVPSNYNSADRMVLARVPFTITSTTTQWNGNPSLIAAALTDATVTLTVGVNGSLSLIDGQITVSGSVNQALNALTPGAAISGATQTLFGTIVGSLTAYTTKLYFDEENQRKANLAVAVLYSEKKFVIPRSRVVFTDYALVQDIDDNAIAATSSIVGLGNGRRGLDIIVNKLNDVATGLMYASTNPEVFVNDDLDGMSFASSLVKPTVITTTMNFASETVNVMNESTRLSEIHGRFMNRFLSMASMMFAKSLMLNQYTTGEKPVMKAWVHSSIADMVIGILNYHPDLDDKAALATGADYSLTLPNGYRLDVIKTNLDCMQNRLYAVPVIESDMSSVLSAASIRDCGTVTTNYTPTNAGAVVRRVATTTREIVMVSNPCGILMNITGLTSEVGNSGYTPVVLNADASESISM